MKPLPAPINYSVVLAGVNVKTNRSDIRLVACRREFVTALERQNPPLRGTVIRIARRIAQIADALAPFRSLDFAADPERNVCRTEQH